MKFPLQSVTGVIGISILHWLAGNENVFGVV
jgi:hypothetical protein